MVLTFSDTFILYAPGYIQPPLYVKITHLLTDSFMSPLKAAFWPDIFVIRKK